MIYVKWSKRFIAFLIDAVISYSVVKLIFVLLHVSLTLAGWMAYAGIFSFLYFVFFLSILKGQTIGSLILGIKTIFGNGKTLDFKKILVKSLFLCITVAPISLTKLIVLSLIIQTLIMYNKSPYRERHLTAWDLYPSSFVIDLRSQPSSYNNFVSENFPEVKSQKVNQKMVLGLPPSVWTGFVTGNIMALLIFKLAQQNNQTILTSFTLGWIIFAFLCFKTKRKTL
jgi:hypothetical protein